MRLKTAVLAITVFGFAAIALVFFWISHRMEDRRLEEQRQELRTEADLLGTVLDATNPQVDRVVDEIAEHVPYRITVITKDGRVAGDSEFSGAELAQLENHATRTEIIEAARTGAGNRDRYSTSLDAWLTYRAVRLRHSDGFVRLALPIPERRPLAPDLRLPFLVLLLATAFASAVMLRRVRRSISEPRARLDNGIEKIGAGKFNCRIGIHSAEDLGSTARSLENLGQEIERRTRRLEAEANNLKAILSSMSEGVLITDTRRRATRVNPAFEKIFNLDSDPVGKSVPEIVRDPVLEEALAEVLGDAVKTRFEEQIRVGDRTLLARLSRLESPGKVMGAVIVFHDITRLRQLERARRDFMSNLSHEFRTPLTSIRGYAETLLDEKCDSSAHQDFLPKIHKHAEQLSQMIEELFRLTSLESNGEQLERQKVNLRTLFLELKKEFHPRLVEKGIDLLTDCEPGAEVVSAHEVYLRRILHNLIDNALHYTDAGQIRLSACRSKDEIVVAVADTGIGIPAEDLKRVFERFYRVNKDRSRRSSGSGIGLALVKHLVLVHGGRVWVESKLEHGSTFYFSLPAGLD